MKNYIIKSMAATTMWVICVAAVFLLAPCTPGVVDISETPKETGSTQSEVDDRPWETWTECAQKPGDHPCNFSLVDQHGNIVELYDYHDKVIVIDFSSIWCSVCQGIATKGDEFTALYGEDGFIWITVLIDGAIHGIPPSPAEIQDWVNTFHVQTPVLTGDRTLIDFNAETGYPINSWPTLIVIDKTMVLYNGLSGWNETTIRAWVETLL